jgi:hypothetical protein
MPHPQKPLSNIISNIISKSSQEKGAIEVLAPSVDPPLTTRDQHSPLSHNMLGDKVGGVMPSGTQGNPAHNPKFRLRMAWVEFISQWKWDWFFTLTFKDFEHPEQAKRKFYRWLRCINKAKFGRIAKDDPNCCVPYVIATEYQQRGAIHYHGLMGDVQELRRMDFVDLWYEQTGSYARIFEAKEDAAIRYCSKYVLKSGGEIDLEIPRYWRPLLKKFME